MTRIRARSVAVCLALALSAQGAAAQSAADPLAPGAAAGPETEAPAHRRVHHDRGSGPLSVTVHNARSVGLVELRVGPASGELKKVAGPLAFGRKTVVRLKRAKDCLYDIHAHFADDADSDQSGIDLCADKAINLTD